MGLRIEVDREALAEFCRRLQVRKLAFFGSVLRDDFGPDSDVDVLVGAASDVRWTLAELVSMEEELSALLRRPVDLIERRVIEQSKNPIRRRHLLGSAEVVYAAG